MGSHMSHLHRNLGVTQFVQDPEVLGEIYRMMSFHVHQLGTEINVLQRCSQVVLIALIQVRMYMWMSRALGSLHGDLCLVCEQKW